MQEHSIINNTYNNSLLLNSSTLSNWRVKHQFYQTNRNFRQLQNRLSILQLQKQSKLKSIQNTLNQHKKYIQTKIYKHQLKQSIQAHHSNQAKLSQSNSRLFHSIRQSRNLNIKKQSHDLVMIKHQLFQQTKNQRLINQRKILLNKIQTIQDKTMKRNKVRLIEIQSKQNIQNFWNSKISYFQQTKKQQINKKILLQQNQLKKLSQIQKQQQSLLQQIKKAQQVSVTLLLSMVQIYLRHYDLNV